MLTYWNLKEFPNNNKVSTLKVLQQLNSIVLLSETLTASTENLQEDLLELQDKKLASTIREQKQRALEFWERNWVFISFCYYPPLFSFYSFSISISSPVFESHTNVWIIVSALCRTSQNQKACSRARKIHVGIEHSSNSMHEQANKNWCSSSGFKYAYSLCWLASQFSLIGSSCF